MMKIKSSANVFRDLLKAPDHVELKAQHDAAAFIRRYGKMNGITHARLAEIADVEEREISKIVHFKLRDISLESLNAIVEKLKSLPIVENK